MANTISLCEFCQWRELLIGHQGEFCGSSFPNETPLLPELLRCSYRSSLSSMPESYNRSACSLFSCLSVRPPLHLLLRLCSSGYVSFCSSKVPELVPSEVYIPSCPCPYLDRTTSLQIHDQGATWLTPSLLAATDRDLRSPAVNVVMIWEVLPDDYLGDDRLLLVKRQQILATHTREKVLLLDHHIALGKVPAGDSTFEARTSTLTVWNCLSVCE